MDWRDAWGQDLSRGAELKPLFVRERVQGLSVKLSALGIVKKREDGDPAMDAEVWRLVIE